MCARSDERTRPLVNFGIIDIKSTEIQNSLHYKSLDGIRTVLSIRSRAHVSVILRDDNDPIVRGLTILAK